MSFHVFNKVTNYSKNLLLIESLKKKSPFILKGKKLFKRSQNKDNQPVVCVLL